jgi:hypothetical protein
MASALAGLGFALVVLSGCASVHSSDAVEAAPAGHPPGPAEVRLVVSRDFGAKVMRDLVVPADDDLDVLRLLAEHADVETEYGGGFIDGIDGLQSSFGAVSSADAADWFYWVDGTLADVGAADWRLRGGETVWWDYHRWADAAVVPAALHAFPRPYAARPLAFTAAADVAGVDEWASAAGLDLETRRGLEDGEPVGGLVMATAAEAAATPWIAQLLGNARSGIEFVSAVAGSRTLLSSDGETGPAASAIAQPVTDPDHPSRPFLVVLGVSRADLVDVLPRLTAESLSATVAVAVVDGELVRLPWGGP